MVMRAAPVPVAIGGLTMSVYVGAHVANRHVHHDADFRPAGLQFLWFRDNPPVPGRACYQTTDVDVSSGRHPLPSAVTLPALRLLVASLPLLGASLAAADASDGAALYARYCAQCHGVNLEGGNGSSFIDGIWQYGDKRHFKVRNIKFGIITAGMPEWQGVLSDAQIESVLTYILAVESSAHAEPPPLPTAVETEDYRLRVDVLATELGEPWALEFVDENRALITERDRGMRWLVDGRLQSEPITGLPAVDTHVQCGYLDLAIDPDYATNAWVYLSFSDFDAAKNVMISIARGRVVDNAWTGQQILFRAPANQYSSRHHNQGSRLMFDDAGHLYFSIGDQGDQDKSQRLDHAAGKIHRINRDGSIPEDNPFVGTANAMPSIFALGNRNAQGLARHPDTGVLWETEHGPMGGDEVNLLASGANYGWPLTTFGLDYDGSLVSKHSELPGITAPVWHWTPSIAVCGIDFHPGTGFPAWTNNLFVTSLKFHQVRRLVLDGPSVVEDEVILRNVGRVRDVDVGPDGAIYILTNSPGRILRLSRSE